MKLAGAFSRFAQWLLCLVLVVVLLLAAWQVLKWLGRPLVWWLGPLEL